MNDPVLLRKEVRRILSAAPRDEKGKRRPLSEMKIFVLADRAARDPLHVDELRAALNWNEAKGFAIQHFDEDEETTAWELSAEGAAKEGVK